jgi:mRNA interferase HicA
MRGNEFIRRIHRYATRNGIPFSWRPDRGKGSHGVLCLGDARTVVRDPKAELKTGTYHAMLKQLGLKERDL